MESGSKMAVMELHDRAGEPTLPDRLVDRAGSGLSGACVLVGDAGTEKIRVLEYAIPEVRLQTHDDEAPNAALEVGFPRQILRMSQEIR
jgi:hypothetical protein